MPYIMLFGNEWDIDFPGRQPVPGAPKCKKPVGRLSTPGPGGSKMEETGWPPINPRSRWLQNGRNWGDFYQGPGWDLHFRATGTG